VKGGYLSFAVLLRHRPRFADDDEGVGVYSGLNPDSFAIAIHLGFSLAMKAAKSWGVPR
jgi:hypothetical protein